MHHRWTRPPRFLPCTAVKRAVAFLFLALRDKYLQMGRRHDISPGLQISVGYFSHDSFRVESARVFSPRHFLPRYPSMLVALTSASAWQSGFTSFPIDNPSLCPLQPPFSLQYIADDMNFF